MSLLIWLFLNAVVLAVFLFHRREQELMKREVFHLRERLQSTQKLLGRQRDLITQNKAG